MDPRYRPPVPWRKVIPGDEVKDRDGRWWLVLAKAEGVYTLQSLKVPSWRFRYEPDPEEPVKRRMGKLLAASHARRFYSDPKPEPIFPNYPLELLPQGPPLPEEWRT